MSTLTAIFNARDRVSKKMKAMSESTSMVTDKFKDLGKIAGKSLAVVGALATGVAAKSLADFSNFDKGMREVWTLLPNMSEEAFGSMQKDVLNFSKKMKVLPEDAIPAVYQALSLGVPKGGVFDFLETANKLAVGGVTDLDLAVNSLRAITKGMGLDLTDTTRISDVLFTTMKNGATSVGELAANFPKVTGVASGLGITVEELGASFSSLTGVTGNTAEVSTQMRSLFVEMSQGGSKLSKTFKGLEASGGKSFKQFINDGGSMKEALDLLNVAVDASDVELIDLFGSIEAASAAIGISGSQSEKYTQDLIEMGKAAGATDDAHKKMDGGLSNLFKNLKVRAKVAFIELGDKLAPTISELGDKFLENLPKLEKFFAIFLEKVPGIVDSVVNGFSSMYDSISSVFNFLDAKFSPIISELSDQLFEFLEKIKNSEAADNIVTGFNEISDVITEVMNALGENKLFLETLVVVFGSLVAIGVVFTTVMAIINGLMAVFAFITSPIGLIIIGIAAAIALLYIGFKTGFFEKVIIAVKKLPEIFKNIFIGIKDTVLDIGKTIVNTYIGIINTVIGLVNKIPGVDIGELGTLKLSDEIKGGDQGGTSAGTLSNEKTTSLLGSAASGGSVDNSKGNTYEVNIAEMGTVRADTVEQTGEGVMNLLRNHLDGQIATEGASGLEY